MTEQEALEKAKEKIRAERAAYMRDWRRRNPDKDKKNREASKRRKLERYMEEVKANE